MIKSFSSVPAFKKQIINIHKGAGPSGYIWRRRADHTIQLYCDGQVIGQSKSTSDLTQMIKDHAKRTGEWFAPDLISHYYTFINNLWRLYINATYSKKSKNKAELEVYVEVLSWLEQSGRGKSWAKK